MYPMFRREFQSKHRCLNPRDIDEESVDDDLKEDFPAEVDSIEG